ncbi:histone-fold-containing protein [Tilletiaria anomala UBC 951]|uniref:Histone-fold-containing protein n=1 Tax=Tilletiaria anomala (strain ATCC 24038 / CBS 436.72 / UBC 951) TaxID=1037660 RepID=A0A066VZF5_TILAU|nr:histone-fold-containing protein [Tilletiaria anomala UBC 951]KDN43895.1 histone-fold-containing protein [Tilletiaria anomala UBC 951]
MDPDRDQIDDQHASANAEALASGVSQTDIELQLRAMRDDGEQSNAAVPSPPHPPATLFQPELLPSANISRLMKATLPATSKISREAKEAVSECLSEFICFITSEANDRCMAEKRKTITGEHILCAMRILGFDNYEMVCKVWLSKYRLAQDAKPRGRQKAASVPLPLEDIE